MMSRALASALILVAVAGCDIDDADRCSEGYHYDPKGLACKVCEEDQTWDPINYNCVDDPDTDDDADAGDDGGPPSGLGEPCDSDEDCAEYEASMCAVNPLTQEGVYCTLADCTPADCPDGWQCCDCLDVDPLNSLACATDQDAAQLSSLAGCDCS